MVARDALVAGGVPVVDVRRRALRGRGGRGLCRRSAVPSPSRLRRPGSCTRATSVACGSIAAATTTSSRPIATSSAKRARPDSSSGYALVQPMVSGRRRSLCRHHQRPGLRARSLLRPRRHFHRGVQGHDDGDGAAVARRRHACDPPHQGRLGAARRARPQAGDIEALADSPGASRGLRGGACRPIPGARSQSHHRQAGRRRRRRGRHRGRSQAARLPRHRRQKGVTERKEKE